MLIVCAWCDNHMGEKTPLKDKSVTHGICEECYKRVTAKVKTERNDDKKEVKPD